jgi:alpha-galactosidase
MKKPCGTSPALLSLSGLLDAAGMDGAEPCSPEARAAFEAGPVMLYAGGWQSWSPGWELFPGESFPARVRIIPDLIRLTAAPWDLDAAGKAGRAGGKSWVSGSFIIYLRAGDWYLVLADEEAGGGSAPAVFRVSPDRRQVEIGRYGKASTEIPAGIRVFCVRGFFAFKDALRELYKQDAVFRSQGFLSKRPGGYESWYNHYTRINENILLDDLGGLLSTDNLIKLRYLDRGKPVVFQIDDGWERAVGDWEIDAERFPRGLKPLAEKTETAGLIPGLWLAPFLVTKKARLFREKPQWLLRDGRGRPVRAGWNPHWDGTYYCLDLSLPGVLEYLGSLINRVIDDWGFRYIKLDFLYAGFLSGGEWYEQACAVLTGRKFTAPELPGGARPVAYLGCGLPLGPSFRHFPLSRIGTDTRESWDWPLARLLNHQGRPSAHLNLRDTLGRSFLNGTVYINDPDVIFLRSNNCRLDAAEKELIALVNFLLAGQIMFSDDPAALGAEDLALTARINGLYDQLDGDEYGAVLLERDVYRLESRSGKIRGIINLSRRPVERDGIAAAPHSISFTSSGRS